MTTTVPGSQGSLCLGGQIGRFVGPGQIQVADASGQASLSVDATSLPQPLGSVGAAYGEAWFFQLWHRDVTASGTPTSNFTNGATVRFF